MAKAQGKSSLAIEHLNKYLEVWVLTNPKLDW